MSGTAQPIPFSMPMFRSFVPERIRPWIYVFIAFTFQFSGGLYLGTLNQMMGETTLMREDLLMCLYANLAGMAIYFPLLFRMKFRFTNKTLLCGAATGVLLCNLVAPHITFLPLLWLVQDLVVWGSYRGIALQSGCTAYHFPTVAVAGMLHRRHVQDTRHVRVHVQHPTLDESDTRLYRILSDAAYCHLGQYAVVRLACHLSDVLLPLGLHATVYLRHHDD